MTLKDWLEESGVEPSVFAERIGRTSESVRRYVNGARIPDRETMPLIFEKTDGRVTANDFFGIRVESERQHICSDTSAAASPSCGKANEVSRQVPA